MATDLLSLITHWKKMLGLLAFKAIEGNCFICYSPEKSNPEHQTNLSHTTFLHLRVLSGEKGDVM